MFRGDCELNSYATSHSLTSECLMRCWKWPPGHGIPLSGLLGVGAGLSPSRHFWARFRMLATALLMSFSERVSASSTTMSSISSIVSGRLPSSRHLSFMSFWMCGNGEKRQYLTRWPCSGRTSWRRRRRTPSNRTRTGCRSPIRRSQFRVRKDNCQNYEWACHSSSEINIWHFVWLT